MKYGFELIGPLMAGEVPERVPVSCNLLEQGANELGVPIREYYSRGDLVAEGQLLLQEHYGNDVVWGFLYTAKAMEILGSSESVFSDHGPPNVGDLVIKNPEDVDSLVIPEDIYEHPVFEPWRTCIEMLHREIGDRIPVVSNVISSFSSPAVMMGIEGWLKQLFLGDPGVTRAILEKAHLYVTRLTEAVRKAGAHIVAYSNPLCSNEFLTHEQFRSLGLPWVQKDLEVIGTADIVYFNAGSPIGDQIGVLLNQCRLGAMYLHPDDDVTAAKRTMKSRGFVVGSINDMKMIRHWSHDEIRQEVRKIMELGAPGGGFMFGTLVMPYAIPPDRIKTMMDAAHEFGSYEAVG